MAPKPEVHSAETAAQVIVAAVTELLACARHDLIGPLNRSASLLALLIQRHRNQIGPDGERILDFLTTSSSRMEEVAAGAGRYIEIACEPREFASVDLSESLRAALTRLEKSTIESGATIEADPLPRISANGGQMTTMFELLIGNSIKFRRPGTAPHIRISAVRTADLYDVAVTDDGIGIDPKYADVLFHPFRRLNGAEYAGPGLGLTAAKLIASLHGGSMRIEQTPDCGVSVHFAVPINPSL